MSKQFDFQDQLKIGTKGEEEWMKRCHWRKELVRLDGRQADFQLQDGRKIELKSDTYDMATSPNFFIERYSDRERKSPGSFWQSLQKVDIFIYYFITNATYFAFDDIHSTIDCVENLVKVKKIRPIWIRNKGWTAEGYKIPRIDLAAHYKEYQLAPTEESESMKDLDSTKELDSTEERT